MQFLVTVAPCAHLAKWHHVHILQSQQNVQCTFLPTSYYSRVQTKNMPHLMPLPFGRSCLFPSVFLVEGPIRVSRIHLIVATIFALSRWAGLGDHDHSADPTQYHHSSKRRNLAWGLGLTEPKERHIQGLGMFYLESLQSAEQITQILELQAIDGL